MSTTSLRAISVAIQLRGTLDRRALEQSLATVAPQDKRLRVAYAAPIALVDLSVFSLPERIAAIHRMMIETDADAQLVDMVQGVRRRPVLARMQPREHVLMLDLYPPMTDGTADCSLVSRFTHELAQGYATATDSDALLSTLTEEYVNEVGPGAGARGGAPSEVAYWRELLESAPIAVGVPPDRPRSLHQAYATALKRHLLPRALSDELHALSDQEDVTIFMILLAATQALLARYTDQTDIIVGSPNDGRRLGASAALIDPRTTVVALRSDLSGNPTFREILSRVRRVVLEAHAHADAPFDQVVDALAIDRVPGRHPLFQVLLVVDEAPLAQWTAGMLTFAPLWSAPPPGTACLVDVTLKIEQTAEGLLATAVYNADSYEAATMQRLLGHFHALLDAVTANPDQRYAEVSLLTNAERQQLAIWNATHQDYPHELCVPQLVAARAASTPHLTALVADDQTLTYRELDRQANMVARHLRSLGVQRGVLVGLCLERSAALVVGALGILKAGGAYVPLDPAYPVARLSFMLHDARAPVLLTQEALIERLPAGLWRVVPLDTLLSQCVDEPATPPPNGASASDIAYVIYTSGSTGQPKGVQITHDSLLNLVYWHRRTFAVTQTDRATQMASPAFDAAVWELWPYLTSGARVYLPAEETRVAPEALRDWLVAQRITISFLPTPLAEDVMALEWPPETALRVLLTGADVLHHYPSPALPFTVVNNYGPTEGAVVATSGRVAPTLEPYQLPSIGRPIANTQIYILDASLQLAPIGLPGELYIGGAGLARAYLNRPELTAEKFIPHPYSDQPGARLYRTGDRARYLSDGVIAFLGRLDQQIKIRGVRIELGEIEAALSQHPAVRETVVVADEDGQCSRRLVAYVVTLAGSRPTTHDLCDYLRTRLPAYMIPAAFVPLEALPVTPNGKVDRAALPSPDEIDDTADDVYSAPRTPVEERLAEIVASLLQTPRVSIDDNFFLLGGHSLLGTQIIAHVRGAFGVELPLRSLFDAPTVAGLADTVEGLILAKLDLMTDDEALSMLT